MQAKSALQPVRKFSRKFALHVRRYWQLHLLALPVFAYILVFSYAPMFGVLIAFQDFNISMGFFGSPVVGLKNFEYIFQTTVAWRITRNTVMYNVAFLFLNTSLSVLMAVVFNELYHKRTAKTLQTMLIMPNFLSMSVIAIVVWGFMGRDGIVDGVIKAFGGETRNWYLYKEVWPFVLTVVYLWKNVGYSAIVYVASISGISQEYYEAAVLDGASKVQQARYITLPHLRHIIVIMFILNLGGLFRGDIGLFYNVTNNNGALYEYTDVIDTYVFRALKTARPGQTAAVGLYQSLVGFALIMLANWVVRKIDEESSLF